MPEQSLHTGAVFLSYASEDADAAARICKALRAAGVEVWFDRSELRGGDAWDSQIKKQIHDCALFVPVISAHTNARSEGYFRREWKLASRRQLDMADDAAFLVPVAIDETREAEARVPEEFLNAQWTRLPGGETPPAFAQRVRQLLGLDTFPVPTAKAAAKWATKTLDLQETKVPKIRPRIFWLSSSLAILIVIVLVTALQFRKPLTGPTKRIESIAVLPLSNLSGDSQQQYFADGMTEAFINELGQLSGLRVISRTSVMQYQETKTPLSKIAQDLKVDAVLEGSVLQAGNRVEITATLLEPRTEKRLWSKTYERDLRDILSLRKEIAHAIVKQIHLTITPEERNRLATARTVDPEAYRLVLRGNFHLGRLNEAAFRKALADFQRAIEIDPSYAPAYAGMAGAYVELGSWFSTLSREEVYPKAKAAALDALELDEQLAEAHFALGVVKYIFEWDWAGADSAFRRGIELNPRSSYGLVNYANYLTAMGRFKESIGIAKRAVDIDPLQPGNYNELSVSYWFAGNRKEAYEQIGKSLELGRDFPQTASLLALYDAMDGKYEEGIRKYHKLYGDNPAKVPTGDSGVVGWMYGRAGRRAEASMLLENLSRRPETKKAFMASLALIHLGLGDEDRSVEMLEKAYENHETSLVWLKTDPFYDTLRDHPRFQALFRRMNFPS